MFFYFIFVVLFLMVFFLLLYFLSFGSFLFSYGKMTPFECGFSSFTNNGVVFSIPFFMISVMFLLFDVEILLICLFPFIIVFSLVKFVGWVVIFLVLFCTLYEWYNGILTWV